jgi:hypothetical protein
MSQTLSCVKCGSGKIIPGARIIDTGKHSIRNLSVCIKKDPNAILLQEPELGELKAIICCACGHTELVTDNLDKLWEAWHIYQAKKQEG